MPPSRLSLLALSGAVLIWGVTLPLTKVALRSFTSIEVTFLRFVFALPVLLLLVSRSQWSRARVPIRYVLALAGTGLVGFYLFLNLGLADVTVTTAALITAIGPALAAMLALPVLGERPVRLVVAGIVLAVVGAAAVGWGGAAGGSATGVAFVFLATCSWAAYVVLVRWLGARIETLPATALSVLVSSVALVPAAVTQPWHAASAAAWFAVAGIGVVGTGIGYVLWNFGAARIDATVSGVYSNVVPLVSVLVAVTVLHEPATAVVAVGGAAILVGAVIATWPGGRMSDDIREQA